MEITNTKPDGTVCGYLFLFNQIDSDADIFLPGCFAKTLKEYWTNPKGIYTVLKEDEKGLYFEAPQNKLIDNPIYYSYVWPRVVFDEKENAFMCGEINLVNNRDPAETRAHPGGVAIVNSNTKEEIYDKLQALTGEDYPYLLIALKRLGYVLDDVFSNLEIRRDRDLSAINYFASGALIMRSLNEVRTDVNNNLIKVGYGKAVQFDLKPVSALKDAGFKDFINSGAPIPMSFANIRKEFGVVGKATTGLKVEDYTGENQPCNILYNHQPDAKLLTKEQILSKYLIEDSETQKVYVIPKVITDAKPDLLVAYNAMQKIEIENQRGVDHVIYTVLKMI